MEDIRALSVGVLDDCASDKLTAECRKSLERLDGELEKATAVLQAQERRDKLIDHLYFNVGSKLNSTFDLNQLLGVVIDSLEKLIGFNAAGVFLVNQQSGEIEAEYTRGYQKEFLGRIHQKVNEGILGWVIENSQPVNIPDVFEDSRYINTCSATVSEAAVPLVSNEAVIGCINLESDLPNAFNDDDIALLETFATQATLAVERAKLLNELLAKSWLEEEISLARKIQLAFLPDNPPEIEGFALAGMNQPSRGVGGDYFDYIPLPGDGMGLVIADVAGKGIGAALIMSGFRASIRGESWHNPDPARLMHIINHFVYESTNTGAFVTAFFGKLTGTRFEYVNAGHFPPVLMHDDGSYELLEQGGMILGIFEEQNYSPRCVEIKSGDTILFYTDGVTEAFNRREEEFGDARLINTLKNMKHVSAKEKVNTLHGRVLGFTGGLPPADDLTIMVLDCK